MGKRNEVLNVHRTKLVQSEFRKVVHNISEFEGDGAKHAHTEKLSKKLGQILKQLTLSFHSVSVFQVHIFVGNN